MAILKFPVEGVRRLVEHARSCKEHKPTWAQREDGETVPAGLWLVGDQGVYLMSNGSPDINDGDRVVYAKGINPDVDAFDDWWARKRRTFGGDDGCEFLPIDDVDEALQGKWFEIKISKTELAVLA